MIIKSSYCSVYKKKAPLEQDRLEHMTAALESYPQDNRYYPVDMDFYRME